MEMLGGNIELKTVLEKQLFLHSVLGILTARLRDDLHVRMRRC